ncbi:MAG: sensor histidine kinase [Nevskiales bacterium]
MSAVAQTTNITNSAPGFERTWGDLRAINLLRWALCALLGSLTLMEEPERLITGVMPDLMPPVLALFLMSATLFTLMLLLRQPALTMQIYLQAWVDVLLLITLVYATGGVDNGLAVLLVTAVIGIATLLPRRAALSLTAFAIFALFFEESLRAWQKLSPGADFTLTGLLCALMLLGSFAANAMARRMRETAALAEQKLLDLANLEQLNERIIQHMAAGVLVVDHTARVRQINAAAREQLGLKGRRAITTLGAINTGLADAWAAWSARREISADGPTLKTEDRELQPHFLRMGEYEPAASLIFLEDMEAVHQRVQQIKQAALGRLTASIAHEIRNPLSAITHASQLLSEWRNSPEEETRLLEIVNKHCLRIDRIISDVLSLSKKRDIQPQNIQLRAWLENQADEYLREHPDTELHLDFASVAEDITVRFDPLHLQQILNNLWDNAYRYAKRDDAPPPRVTHRAHPRPNLNATELEICDNGPGIPAERQGQIFEPFYTSQSSGTGLGLYIARELCECNHAQIGIQQTAAQGACFQIRFTNTWQAAPQ